MKHEYHEGPKAGENFEKLARAVLQAPKVVVPKKQPKAKPNSPWGKPEPGRSRPSGAKAPLIPKLYGTTKVEPFQNETSTTGC